MLIARTRLHTVMAYIVLAYILIACIFMAYIVMAVPRKYLLRTNFLSPARAMLCSIGSFLARTPSALFAFRVTAWHRHSPEHFDKGH